MIRQVNRGQSTLAAASAWRGTGLQTGAASVSCSGRGSSAAQNAVDVTAIVGRKVPARCADVVVDLLGRLGPTETHRHRRVRQHTCVCDACFQDIVRATTVETVRSIVLAVAANEQRQSRQLRS